VRIFGLTVGRNEADRYLVPMLCHMHDILDAHFFFDDRSDDQTMEIAAGYDCTVMLRPNGVSSFVENEGAFRGEAWKTFEVMMRPAPGDWVFVIDCDEVLTSAVLGEERKCLEEIIAQNHPAITLAIPEVWGFDKDGCPLIRMDGQWGLIHAPRLFAYQEGGDYFQGDFGVPAVPNYVMAAGKGQTRDLALLHYGYADPRDQIEKYKRYNGHYGHGNAHVQSIIAANMELVRWDREYVMDMRRALW
jgi:hypothetical protein